MAKKRTYYLHTLNGAPASYHPGGQICYASYGGAAIRLCASLKQIRAERNLSEEWRAKKGYEPTHPSWFGYRRVAVR